MNQQEAAYTTSETLKDGNIVKIRPVHSNDGDHPEKIKRNFSDNSILQRFLGYIPVFSQKLIEDLTTIDYKCKMALVAIDNTETDDEIIAIARIGCECDEIAEFAIIVGDKWQGLGLASLMMDKMIQISRDLNYKTMHAYTFANNYKMIGMFKKRNFVLSKEDSRTVIATLVL
ncbi:MAG: acetyltransferase [Saprospiraceae bacterium]|jgi:acetyltransferase